MGIRHCPWLRRNLMIILRLFLVMKPTPIISEKKAAIVIWIGAAVFTIGAMIFGH
jgi:hypothetical protein